MSPNRLAGETSPYLRQHADNPVDWYPWGEEAFARAAAEDKPIFLSVGYSACHWCHVMAHESFEDPATAAALNRSFVSVKVDREERPDVDAVYMEAVQSLTGSGGWPMSVFLTPDGRPFFGGTYFPPVDRPGTPSFRTVLAALTDVWGLRRPEVEAQADELSEAIRSRSVLPASVGPASPTAPDGRAGDRIDLLDAAVTALIDRFDPEWGGFGSAPKFPQPALVDLALRHADVHRGSPEGGRSLAMATRTLDAMAAGGIHDHLAGGFARYSTDRQWLIPHFEKMLYDQAGLLRAYLHGWQVTGSGEYLATMTGIVNYVDHYLTAPEGGLHAAEDADAGGVEGRFYAWTPEEVAAVVDGSVDASDRRSLHAGSEALIDFFGVTAAGNFDGTSVLHRPVGQPLRGDEAIEAGRALLAEARDRRIRPALDDKVLTEWNAMYASALAEAAAGTGIPGWRDAAVAVGDFLVAELQDDDGRWYRSWQAGSGARHLAYAGDYAWLIDCFTRLGELTGEAGWTDRAVAVADGLLDLFHDGEGGGFFTTGHDAETLIVRTKDVFDGATPSANAVAGLALARLGALTSSARVNEAAREVVDMFGELLTRHPTAFAHSVLTASLLTEGFTEIVVAGGRPDLVDVVRSQWRPDAVLAWGQPTSSPLWEGRSGHRAYVCRNYACQVPADDVETLSAQLRPTPRPGEIR